MTETAETSAGPVRWPAATVEDFLTYGFVPTLDVDDPLCLLSDWSRGHQRPVEEVTGDGLVREGRAALRAAMEQRLASGDSSREQVVFLSGGLDSRVILGALLEMFDTSQIVAATFGMPGEQDFDFACEVARTAGVRHEILESSSVRWTTDGLVDSVLARERPLPKVFGQRYLSYLLHHRIGRDSVFWDGLCGDGIGGKLSPREGEDWTWGSALEEFLNFHLAPYWRQLVPRGYDPRACLPDTPFCSKEELAYPDQLVFGIRQRCYTSTRLLRDFRVRTPFLSQAWLDFMLTVPVRYRQDQRLYRAIQRAAFPRLFALPTTSLDGGAVTEPRIRTAARDLRFRARRKAGAIGLLPPPRTGDVSANTAIRRNLHRPGPIQDLVVQNLEDLAARGVLDWLDVRRFVPSSGAEPQPEQAVVVRLLNLELNLKAEDRLRDAPAPERPVAVPRHG